MLGSVDDLMSIGEFSDRCGLSPKRLRSYATAGLLLPAAVDARSGYRYYSPEQLRNARLIDALREAGMPLTDIAAVLRDPSPEQLDVWARRVAVDAAQRHQALAVARILIAGDAGPSTPDEHRHTGRDPSMRLTMAARTDIGRVRQNNEDAVGCTPRLAVVADGMGGHPGGEVASAVAVSLVESAFTGRSSDELQAAVRAANRAIWNRADGSSELEGMGTTVCAVGLTEEQRLAVVSVGDTRAYLFRDGTLRQLTVDHTVTADLVRTGELTEEQAREHPHRHVLTRVLGLGPDVDPDMTHHDAQARDVVVVCTDGLFNELADDEIAALLTTTHDVGVAAEALVEQAVLRGGHDNVSAIVIEVCA